jgi:hypothetical protein
MLVIENIRCVWHLFCMHCCTPPVLLLPTELLEDFHSRTVLQPASAPPAPSSSRCLNVPAAGSRAAASAASTPADREL